ncbi:hypothetical protein J5Y09_21040 [Roseomonas sp. PWR1]|uniref:Uncharacterized protein n=1 Tax=Roseomonas nitratireducens TaxID=2820810 RepID=A0ABS4AYH8_9PROT|nr:hypothetical protein [Neoroseomonas nitratireducens]MBP0466427.1 hypothetical protein [Neoroseomonas nitratireducens]
MTRRARTSRATKFGIAALLAAGGIALLALGDGVLAGGMLLGFGALGAHAAVRSGQGEEGDGADAGDGSGDGGGGGGE